MSKIGLRYVSACRDTSGYAAAARDYICALLDSGQVDLSLKIASFEQSKVRHESFEKKVAGLLDKPVPAKIQIVHLTPENFPSCRAPGLYNIAYTAWETENLPQGWADLLNSMEEVWVPSTWNKQVFQESGVRTPIHVIPHVVNGPIKAAQESLSFPDACQDGYVFYSIFQWLERKNPRQLLTAYFTEFTKEDDVFLLLKTYRMNCSNAEKQAIRGDIENIKKSLNLRYYPPVIFFGDLLTREQISAVHGRGDCYVSLQRGEGFGIPLAEAMSHGKPVVTTRYGGCLEFMNDDNSFLVESRREPVQGMIFRNYHGHMVWGDPDIMEAKRLMRHCYENQTEAKLVGQKAAQHIADNYNASAVADKIIERLRAILKDKE
jgi:glycosyltransferase involved in cell wall biosynthesis